MLLRPSFYADFTNDYGYLDPRLAFTRLVTPGTYVDRQGVMRTRSANNPRFNHHQLTGMPLGLLGETGATNLVLQSENFSSASWSKTLSTITGAIAAPDGTTNGQLLTVTGANGFLAQAFTVTAGALVVVSAFAQKAATNFFKLMVNGGAGGNVVVCFDLNLGLVGVNGTGGAQNSFVFATIEPWPNGWYRCTVAAATTGLTALSWVCAPQATNSVTANLGGEACYVWGAMATQAAGIAQPLFFRNSSYITTAAATVARNNDNCFMNLPDASWFDQYQGTFFADFSIPVGTGGNGAGIIGVGATTTDYIQIGYSFRADATGINNSYFGMMGAAGVSQNPSTPIDSGQCAYDTPTRIALGYKINDLTTMSVNGRPVVRAAVPATLWPAAPQRMTIGGSGWGTAMATGLNIRRVAYFPRKLTDAQMQMITQ